MDPVSIAASCIAFVQAADATVRTIRGFIVDYKGARGDLSAINQELSQLKFTVNLLEDLVLGGRQTDDPIPSSIRDGIRDMIQTCLDVAKEIDSVLAEHRGRSAALSWAARGKQRVGSLKPVLEANRRALNLIVDTITLATTKSIKSDTEAILDDAAEIKEDTSKILEEIARLQALVVTDNPAESSESVLSRRCLDDLSSVAGSVCGEVSRPGSPESFPEDSATLAEPEVASKDHVLEEAEVRTRRWPLKPLPTRPQQAAVKKDESPRKEKAKAKTRTKFAARPKSLHNKPARQRSQRGESSQAAARPSPAMPASSRPIPPDPLPGGLRGKNQPSLGQEYVLAGDSSLMLLGPGMSVLQGRLSNLPQSKSFVCTRESFLSKKHLTWGRSVRRISSDETKIYVSGADPESRVQIIHLPSMTSGGSFPDMGMSFTNLTTDGSIFSGRKYPISTFTEFDSTALYDSATGRYRRDADGIPEGDSSDRPDIPDISFPVNSARGLCLQRILDKTSGVSPLHLYQITRRVPTASTQSGLDIEDVVLSDTRCGKLDGGFNFSSDGHHIIALRDLDTNPVADVWSFQGGLAAEGDLRTKVDQADQRSIPLEPYRRPDGEAHSCLVKSVTIRGNLVLALASSERYNLKKRRSWDWSATGWSLDTGELLFRHALGPWTGNTVFQGTLSRDGKLMRVMRSATKDEEEPWKMTSRDYGYLRLYSILEIDGPVLRLVQNFAYFCTKNGNMLDNGIGRTFFMSRAESTSGEETAAWVFDSVLTVKRVDGS